MEIKGSSGRTLRDRNFISKRFIKRRLKMGGDALVPRLQPEKDVNGSGVPSTHAGPLPNKKD